MWKWMKRGACLGCLLVPVALVGLVVVLVFVPLTSGVGVRGQGPASGLVPTCVPMGVAPNSTAFRRVVGPGC